MSVVTRLLGMSLISQTLPRELFPLNIQEFLAAKQGLASRGQSLDFTFDYIQWLCQRDRGNCDELLESITSENSDLEKLTLNPLIIKSTKESEKLFGVIPRHGYLLFFLPFFPIILVFVSANGVAFLLTGFLETLLRYTFECSINSVCAYSKEIIYFSLLMLNPSPELFGKIWISLTFVMFSPFLYFLYSILRNVVSK